MQCFRLTQDPDYVNAPVIPNVIQQIHPRYIMPEQAHQIAETTIFQLAGNEKHDFIDLLDRQLFLVTTPLQEVIKLYAPKVDFKMVVLVNSVQQQTYHLPIFEPIDCLSDKSIMTPDKSKVKHLVLKHSSIEHYPIFRVQSRETIIIVRLDAAESILRRDFRGIDLHRVEIE